MDGKPTEQTLKLLLREAEMYAGIAENAASVSREKVGQLSTAIGVYLVAEGAVRDLDKKEGS